MGRASASRLEPPKLLDTLGGFGAFLLGRRFALRQVARRRRRVQNLRTFARSTSTQGGSSTPRYARVEQPAVASLVKVVIAPEHIHDFHGAASIYVRGARDYKLDKSCMRLDVLESTDAANTFFILRAFATIDGFNFHKTTAHYDVWAAFAASRGVSSQEETHFDFQSIPGAWAFQAQDAHSSRVENGVLVTVDIKPDRVGDFLEAMHADAMGSRDRRLDPGCLRLDVLRDAEEPNRFHFFEAYSTDEAAAHHKTTAHYKAWADFKATGGVEGQTVQKWRSVSSDLPGFQSATVKLGDLEMPMLGFGCYKVGIVPASASSSAPSTPQGQAACGKVIQDAVSCGYRMFDSAQFYMNEAWVGAAIAESGVAREELFIMSKVWNDVIYQGADAVKAQVEKTIDELQCGYLDLCLIHWPVPDKHIDAYKALRECKAAGRVKEIGISNYTIEDYEDLRAGGGFDVDGKDKPVCNQIEVNPSLFRRRTIDFFHREGVHVQAYRGLMQGGEAWEQPALQEVCLETGRTSAQVLGRFLVQQGISHIAKASSVERMQENAALYGFSLTREQMDKLSNVTTPKALDAFSALYAKCIWRDTPREGEALPVERTWE